MRGKFRSVSELIQTLNDNNVNYLILRNYECLLDDSIYVGGHEDIDFLCEDSQNCIDTLGAFSNRKKEDMTHYHLFVSDNRVNLDLRHVGDGYYCKKWQQDMLQRKVLYKGYYVLDPTDYFYSLIYHAIVQKDIFSEDYRDRLVQMAKNMNITIQGDTYFDFINVLEAYMIKNGYKYVYSVDESIPLHFERVCSSLIEENLTLRIKHLLFSIRHRYIPKIIRRVYARR